MRANRIYVAATDAPLSAKVATNGRKLDSLLTKYENARKGRDACEWHMGRVLREIHESAHWKTRVTPAGVPRYSSFDAFIVAEKGISGTQAYRLIELAKGYSTPNVVRDIGTTKAHVILRAPAKDREALIEKARAGISRDRLVDLVRHLRDRSGWRGASQQALAGMKGGTSKARKGREAAAAEDTSRVAALEAALSKIVASVKKGRFDSVLMVATEALIAA